MAGDKVVALLTAKGARGGEWGQQRGGEGFQRKRLHSEKKKIKPPENPKKPKKKKKTPFGEAKVLPTRHE